jgi:hypothetical protein
MATQNPWLLRHQLITLSHSSRTCATQHRDQANCLVARNNISVTRNKMSRKIGKKKRVTPELSLAKKASAIKERGMLGR